MFSWIVRLFTVAMKRVPMLIPSAPRARAATRPRASPKAARGDHQDLDLVGRGQDQDQAGNVVLARVAGAFEAVDRNGVDAHPLGRQGVADRSAFVDHLDSVLLEFLDVLDRLVAGGSRRS